MLIQWCPFDDNIIIRVTITAGKHQGVTANYAGILNINLVKAGLLQMRMTSPIKCARD
jgi:hypothetical protein